MKKLGLFVMALLSTVASFAVDPHGARVYTTHNEPTTFGTVIMIIMILINNLLAPKSPTFRQRCEENNGIFIELKPNLVGLADYKTDIQYGRNVEVYVKRIIPEKKKIKLKIV